MLLIFNGACVMKKCEYLPSAEYPAVIITTPAINLPRPSVTPEAVRNSVSMFSLITGARAGISFRNSGSAAARQRVRPGARVAFEAAKTEDSRAQIRMADGNWRPPCADQNSFRERAQQSIEYNRFCRALV